MNFQLGGNEEGSYREEKKPPQSSYDEANRAFPLPEWYLLVLF